MQLTLYMSFVFVSRVCDDTIIINVRNAKILYDFVCRMCDGTIINNVDNVKILYDFVCRVCDDTIINNVDNAKILYDCDGTIIISVDNAMGFCDALFEVLFHMPFSYKTLCSISPVYCFLSVK
ncbi:hypothetical protein CHS0354_012856 [Potamilus streckersoni]|uniref:Uncharacterized protein n=1 Tax=Potamilus streckersoni TaxID=2493646 RepID=A0AAE0W237_9BIVA|nr:hypothetical protein CHS0354_012856 [Potamilus streckersoni]